MGKSVAFGNDLSTFRGITRMWRLTLVSHMTYSICMMEPERLSDNSVSKTGDSYANV